jgi:hypothetical protein
MFKEGDKIITSKGRFGVIIKSNLKKSIVSIGQKEHEIYNSELLLVDNAKAVEIEYYIDTVQYYNAPSKEIVYINKKCILFDFSKPLSNPIVDICYDKLRKRINKNVIITKLLLV